MLRDDDNEEDGIAACNLPLMPELPGRELSENEEPAESDRDDLDDDSPTVVECPHCRRDVFEDAQRCQYCGWYVTREEAQCRPVHILKKWFAFILALIFLFMTIGIMALRMRPSARPHTNAPLGNHVGQVYIPGNSLNA